MPAKALLPVVAVGFISAVHAGPYDDCILENMRGVSSDTAARAIQTACLRTVEEVLPKSAIRLIQPGSKARYVPNIGLFIEIRNRSKYTLTRLTVTITSRETRKAHDYALGFFEPEGVAEGRTVIEDHYSPSLHSIQSGETKSFRVPSVEEVASSDEFGQRFFWVVSDAWGF